MRHKMLTLFLGGALLTGAVAIAWPQLQFYRYTGHFFPIRRIESLREPMTVANWSAEGLVLADGGTISLPGIHGLPATSLALQELTKRGIELEPDGRVYGLVRIHHWCGNDPVREDIVRVDLSDALIFLHVGQTTLPIPEPDGTARTAGGRFSEWGWNISEFLQFQSWERLKNRP